MIEKIIVFDDEARLWEVCEEKVRETVSWVAGTGHRSGIFVSGGGTFVPFYETIGDIEADVFPTDERMVQSGSSSDTGAMLQREWFDRLVYPQARLVQVPRLGDAPSTAFGYETILRNWQAQGGAWAVALLGVGKDGHTASLFPKQQHVWEANQSLVVPAEGEQEPFVARVSVGPALLQQVPRHIFVITGSGKTDIAKKWLRDRERLPVEYLQPLEERYILLDAIAARDLDPKSYERA
jgi:6-phosphogluconolactonase